MILPIRGRIVYSGRLLDRVSPWRPFSRNPTNSTDMPGKPDLSKRSYQKELLDGEGLPFAAIERNMLELDFINTWLGGHAISIRGLASFVNGRQRMHICEIG